MRRPIRTLGCSGLAAILLVAALGLPRAEKLEAPSVPALPQTDAAIVHALNRLGYGPRPGEVARVRALGLESWIERQLRPSKIEDAETAKRLARLSTTRMSQVELLVAYPPPPLLRALGQRLTRGMGMDPDQIDRLFPELERIRAREREGDTGRNSRDEAAPGRGERALLQGPGRVVAELGQAKLIRAVYTERQLEEVMVDFWFNHFNVFVGKGLDRWLTGSYERDAIRPHALGNFRELLGAVAEHPAMLFYLDNWTSTAAGVDFDRRDMQLVADDAIRRQGLPPGGVATLILRERGMDTRRVEQQIERRQRFAGRLRGRGRAPRFDDPDEPRRRGLNENYARELLELHTLGVDGPYTQQDVIEVARCFTGWTLLPLHAGQQFVYVDELHEGGTKKVLGKKIQGKGVREGRAVLDLLATHPSTARFVSTKLARRFLADEPPPALVERMSVSFLESEGDIRAVLRTLFYSEEFWAPEYRRAKVKTPFEYVVSSLRATAAELADLPPAASGEQTMMAIRSRPQRRELPGVLFSLRQMGQPPYGAQPPTGYADTAEAWVSSGALLARMKFALGLAGDKIPGVRFEPTLPPSAGGPEDQLAALGSRLFGQQPAPATIEAIVEQLEGDPERFGFSARVLRHPEGRARFTTGWLLASAEFQRR